jgi:hypothetical protein
MSLRAKLLRSMALVILAAAAPMTIEAETVVAKTFVCQTLDDWYGYECLSCANYEDGCSDPNAYYAFCCQTVWSGEPVSSEYLGEDCHTWVGSDPYACAVND